MFEVSSAVLAANALYSSAAQFGHEARLEPAPALIIATHGPDSGISRSVHQALMGYRQSTQVCLSGSPELIMEQLSNFTHQHRRFAFTVLAYEMHHLSVTQAAELLGRARDMMYEGTLLLVDYTLADTPKDSVAEATRSTAEQMQIQRYGGLDSWLAAHCRFNASLMRDLVRSVGFPICVDRQLPASRHLLIASDRNVQR